MEITPRTCIKSDGTLLYVEQVYHCYGFSLAHSSYHLRYCFENWHTTLPQQLVDVRNEGSSDKGDSSGQS